jgi:hypothetical protein
MITGHLDNAFGRQPSHVAVRALRSNRTRKLRSKEKDAVLGPQAGCRRQGGT